jgi:hypothetical protein
LRKAFNYDELEDDLFWARMKIEYEAIVKGQERLEARKAAREVKKAERGARDARRLRREARRAAGLPRERRRKPITTEKGRKISESLQRVYSKPWNRKFILRKQQETRLANLKPKQAENRPGGEPNAAALAEVQATI